MSNKMNMQNERCFQAEAFLMIAFVIGILLVIMVPPMGTPDENAHYINAYSISMGELFPQIVDQQVVRAIPQKYIDFVEKYNGLYSGKLDKKYSFMEAYLDSWLPNEENDVYQYQTKLNAISPVGYIFSAIGMMIGRIYGAFAGQLNTLPYNLMLYGRMGNLIFYLVTIYIAIRITPHFKNTLLCVGLMPMSIFLGSSLNYDAVLISVSMLYVACILRVFYEKYVDKNIFLLLALATFLMAGIKQECIALLSILFIIPDKCFGGGRRRKIAIGVFISIIVIALIPTLICSLLKSRAIDPNGSLIDEQLHYLVTHINEFPSIIWNTLKLNLSFYLASFWGKLGQLDINFPIPILMLGFSGLLVVAIIECCTSGNIVIECKYRVLFIVSIFISVIVLFIAIYVTWTPLPGIAEGVGTQYVSGIQGRYFIPFFIPTTIALSNGLMSKAKIGCCLNEIVNRIAIFLSVGYGVMTIWIIFVRFWC